MHEFVTAINGAGTTLILMLLAIFLGIWLNRRDVNQLRVDIKEDVNQLRADMNLGFSKVDARFNAVDARFNAVDARFNAMAGRIDRIHEDFSNFHHTLGQHDARLDALESE